MGGRSSEHEISLASARSVIEALDPERYEVVTVEIGRDGRWALGPGTPEASSPGRHDAGPDAALPGAAGEVAAALGRASTSSCPILHGPFGEDGRRAGAARAGRTSRTSAPACRLGALHGQGPVQGGHARPAASRSRGTSRCATAPRRENPFGYPVFVKPARLGSSVGISKAHDDGGARAPRSSSRSAHDEKVLVEEFVAGIEVEVGVLGNREPFASLAGEIAVTHNEWYDYEAKYEDGEMDLVVPARITPEQTARVQELAVQAFVATECEGMARVDCFVRDDGEVLVNELNTIPGFTATSVYAKLFEASGIAVPRAARPAGRARARAPRAPLAAAPAS